MEKILLMPQQVKFFDKRAERKNLFDIIIAFNLEESFDVSRFDAEVNQALELSKVGCLRMSEMSYMSDSCTRYQTTILGRGEAPEGDLNRTADWIFLKAAEHIDVSAGRFIVGYLTGPHLFLVFNHLIFDLEGVYCFFDEIAGIVKYQPVNCSANPNELVRLIQSKADSFTDQELERPWAGREICNFIVEIDCPNPLESDFRMSQQVPLLDPGKLSEVELNLVSPTNGKNKGMNYLLYGALLAANYRTSGNESLFGHFNHTYSGIPCFNKFTNIITWKVAGVPFIMDCYRPGAEGDVRSYLKGVKGCLDPFFNEGFKIDVLRQRKSNPALAARLDSPILLFNYRSEISKMEKKASECGLQLIESGYEYVPRLFSYPARHLFDLNFNKYVDGLFLTIEYSSKNYSGEFVDKFILVFQECFRALLEGCKTPVFK